MGFVSVSSASASGSFQVPYACVRCGFSTAAMVQAQGHATSLDYAQIEQLAHEAAYRRACAVVSAVPCPRCGGESRAFAELYAAWSRRARARRHLRLALGIAGAIMIAGSSAGCALCYDSLEESAPGVGLWAGLWTVLLIPILVILGPDPTPRLASNPHVYFPEAA